MILRSLLFVPGDSERKLAKAGGIPADALVLDLEDSVAPGRKPAAREVVLEYLRANRVRRASGLWVRVNPITTPDALTDLEYVMEGRPDGILLPKTQSPADVRTLGLYLDALEARHGYEAGSTPIIPVCTETPQAIFSLGEYQGCSPRLAALTWGAEDLSSAIGASTNKMPDGDWSTPYQLVRSLCLFAAHAAGVQAVDTLHADFRDAAGLKTAAEHARRDGFGGKLAIHPDQVGIINAAFVPSAEEVASARRIVAAFQEQPDAGTLSLDGRMLDAPHLRQAQRILELAVCAGK